VKRLAHSARDFTLENVQTTLFAMLSPRNARQVLLFFKGLLHAQSDFKNDLFECMTVCWEVGSTAASTIIATRLLDVRSDRRLRVQNYRGWRDAAHGTCKIIPTDVMISTPRIGLRESDRPVHEVINPGNSISARQHSRFTRSPSTVARSIARQGTYFDVPLFYTSE